MTRLSRVTTPPAPPHTPSLTQPAESYRILRSVEIAAEAAVHRNRIREATVSRGRAASDAD